MTPLLAGILAGLWLGLVIYLRVRRAWLLYYVVAAVGFTLLIVFFTRGTLVEEALEGITAQHAHEVAGLVGVPTLIFRNAPGTMLVLVVVGRIGWTVIQIDVECSGLLEMAAFAGLLLFYPGLRTRRRLVYLVSGLVATYLVNILRLLVIIAFLHWGGKDVIFLAHTIVGRGIFFLLVIGIYWFVFTRAAIHTVRDRIGAV
jgi:exosortase family protein XrtG